MMTVEKQVKLFMYVVYLIGLIIGCTVGVILVIKSFGETRETRLKLYEEDILKWNTTKRAEFKNTNFLVQFINNGTSVDANDTLTENTSESVEFQLAEDKYGELPSYDPLYYSRREKASWFGVTDLISSFNVLETLEFNISIPSSPDNQVVTIPKLDLYKVNAVKMANEGGCLRNRGHFEYTGNTCYIYSILSHICVQLDKDDSGKWYLHTNAQTNGFGCYTQTHNATSYEVISLEPGQRIDDKYPFTMGYITWTIRSSYDPLLLAKVLTEDTNNFGLGYFELRYIGFALLF